ncbi:hypothetical protein P8452_28802 [Trifolium repens]|nr:hypothetical protein P8452_28802 [Trifolium repens]
MVSVRVEDMLGEKQHAAGWIGGFGYVMVDLGKIGIYIESLIHLQTNLQLEVERNKEIFITYHSLQSPSSISFNLNYELVVVRSYRRCQEEI